MHQQFEDPQMARQVRGLYNYHVGQKAAVGRVLFLIFAASALVFWGALTFDLLSELLRGFARAFSAH